MPTWNTAREMKARLAALDRSQACIEFAMDGTILGANANFLAAMGYRLDEIKGRHHSIFVDPEQARRPAYRAFWEKLRAGSFDAGEYCRLAKGGREIWIQASYNPVCDNQGRPFKVIKFATDITRQKTICTDASGQIDAISKSQAVIQFNLDGSIIAANQNFLSAMGYTAEEIQGRHHRMFIDPTHAASDDYRRFWERLARGEYDAGEYRRIAKGGREVWIQASYNPILDDSGRPFKVVKFATDITRQKLIAADTAGQLAAVGKSQAVIHFNLDGTIIDANPNFLAAVGYSLAEIKGRHHRIFVDQAYAASPEYAAFWDKLRAGAYDAGEYRRIGKNGREIWIQASYNPVFDMNGKPFKVVKFASDITSAMEARLAVARLVDQSTSNINGVASTAEQMSVSILKINESMSQSQAAVGDIVRKINEAGASTGELQKSSEAMEKIVGLIRDIAGRVNLLALNATIEAARAGEAGKGFSVVASEVKALAGQTADATDSISREIAEVQSMSVAVANIVQGAVNSAGLVSEHVNAVASALEQQGNATREISSSSQGASSALADINMQVKKIASR